ncbi:alginate biosynthesis sensor protein KinB [Clostridium homopropionicum DSM 5847]|uniref:histidine kinase n=1 Tax=Clostridium homopropionicum DSM 5847 TaxID=1121318 RepID=A0A0L6ZCZ9_9CLOT|nr:ATP-binding protein [Clostridium homopropionicum]KOA20851.1 alginate biosynthesis sensor protein KinB [Clostridium homopropionicum DSM 5847]SFF87466.1 PAS domain S-box-containing protein [Clostridium homopropionicum]
MKKFRSIKSKILTIYFVLIVALIISSVWSVINFRRLNDSIDNIMESNYRSIVAAQNMIEAIERQDSAELGYLFANDKGMVDIFYYNQMQFLKYLSIAEDNITEKDESKTIDKLNKLYSQYMQSFLTLKEMYGKIQMGIDNSYYYNNILPLFNSTKAECRNLLNINQEAMVVKKNNAKNIAAKATYSTILLSIVIILIGLILLLYLTEEIVKPIHILIEKIKKISEGYYGQKLEVEGNDEIANLAYEFNIMSDKLKNYEMLNINKLLKEKRKSEGIVESISDGVIVTDNSNNITLVNRAAEKILDIREREVLNKHFLECIGRQDMFEIINNVSVNKGYDEYKNYEDITIKDNEIDKYYRINVTPIISDSGEYFGVVTLLQDITKLKEIDQVKSEFVSTVSHEFRTPLTSISMGVDLLLENTLGNINDDQREIIQAIKEDQIRLKKFVDELLDLSRIQSGRMKMNIEKFDIKDMIENTVRVFNLQLKEKNIKLNLEINNRNNNVMGDISKISLVISNLIGNAIRYTPTDGSGIITVGCKFRNNKMLVYVSNNGAGIPKEYHKKIFEKFVQLKDDNNGSTGGAGLGLAISKEIINAHGGDIWVTSKEGEVTTFYFTLNIDK